MQPRCWKVQGRLGIISTNLLAVWEKHFVALCMSTLQMGQVWLLVQQGEQKVWPLVQEGTGARVMTLRHTGHSSSSSSPPSSFCQYFITTAAAQLSLQSYKTQITFFS